MSQPERTYDPEVARRERLRRQEKRIESLEKLLDEAIRLLGIVCQLAASGRCQTLTVLAVAELVDAYQPPPAIEYERLLELLGEPS